MRGKIVSGVLVFALAFSCFGPYVEAETEKTAVREELPDGGISLESTEEGTFENPFTDVTSDDWYYDSIAYVYDHGIMTGLDDQTFGPTEPLARAQFALILYRMNEEPETEYKDIFPDVPDNQWYTDAILWASQNGIVTGYGNTGRFGPSDNINREQMAVMMYRYAGFMKYDTGNRADFSGYLDAENVNDFAREAMEWAVGNGIITGKYNETVLDPQGNASRAECATIIMRFAEKYSPGCLSDLTADEQYFLTDKEYTVLFTVEASEEINYVDLYSDEGIAADMHDDGEEGDAAANDGIYSCRLSLKKTDPGTFTYYAQAENFRSGDFSLYFFGEPTEESESEYLRTEESLREISSRYEDASGYVPEESKPAVMADVRACLDQLVSDRTVLFYETEKDSAYIKFTSGLTFMFDLPAEGVNAGGSDVSLSFLVCQPNPDLQNDNWENTISQIKDNFDNITDTREYTGQDVTLDLVKNIGNNQIVLWNGHGGYGPLVKNYLATGESFDWDAWLSNEDGYREDCAQDRVIMRCTKEQFNLACVTSKFIDEYCGDLSGDLILLLSCHGGHGSRLADAFLNKGASAVLGFNEEVYAKYSNDLVNAILFYMMQVNPDDYNYITLSRALEASKETVGSDDLAYARMHDFNHIKSTAAEPVIFGGETAENYRLATTGLGTLSGQVLLEDQTTPAADVTVEVRNEKGESVTGGNTNDQGGFSFELLEDTYQLKFSKEGYGTETLTVTTRRDTMVILQNPVILKKIPALFCGFSGCVVDESGSPLEDVTVTVRKSGTEDVSATRVTGKDGSFTVTLEPGTYDLVFAKDGYETVTRTETTSADGYQSLGEVVMAGPSRNEKEIWTADDFRGMDGSTDSYVLMQNLDLTDSPRIEFNGTFDGNGHTIKIPFSEKNGMFSTLGEQASVQNCRIDYGRYNSASLPSGEYNFAGIALENNGTVSKCEADGNIIASNAYTGVNVEISTFCVKNNGKITNCRSNVNYRIIGHQSAWWYIISGIGGDAWSRGTIEKCLNTGDIYAMIYNENSYNLLQDIMIAGVGNSTSVSDCANTGNITLYYYSILMDTADAATSVGFITPGEFYTTGYDLAAHGFPEALKGRGDSAVSEDCILNYTNNTEDYYNNPVYEKKTYTAEETEDMSVKSEAAILQWWNSINS